MSIKQLLCPARIRRIPAQFSWIDQRLVRNHLISRCSTDALALYLFLVTVADAQGLSYYSDQSIVSRLTCMDPVRLAVARAELQRVGWIAYEPPLYQVLALDVNAPERPRVSKHCSPTPATSPVVPQMAQPVKVIELLHRALEGRHD